MSLSTPQTDMTRLAPYVADIAQAAEEFGLPGALLGAVCLRESEAGWAQPYAPKGTHLGWGDRDDRGRFHAFGLFQADERFHGAWIGTADSLTPIGQARHAAEEIARNLVLFRAANASQPDDVLQRAAVAAYNAAKGSVAGQLLAQRDVDLVTTGDNYSADVFRRAEGLTRQGIFPARNA
jgi:hypothetical protein